jgi:hypothetical protein
MSTPRRRGIATPWLVATVAAVVAVALAVVLFAFIRPASSDHRRAGVVAFTGAQKAAMAAASVETVNLLSYRRASFDADYRRAVSGTTGALQADLAGKRASTLQAMTTGKIDLRADVSDVGLETSSDKGVVVLVLVTGYTVDDKGTATTTGVQRLEVTMVKSGSKWLAGDLQSIGVA